MKPFIKEYTNDQQLKEAIQILKDKGIHKEDVYVLSHDDDRTNRIADGADANTIGIREMDIGHAVGNLFSTQGDELRTKLTEIGFSQAEAENYEEDMDEGKVLLIVTNHEEVNRYLQ
ncbi:MAG: general stress protein [Bacillota bacterium]|uniref:General stress protein n=1 Tax=Virgibacillus salarius TaxID=447199 RepID=A0A941DVY0_9BACI|nr:MULTISPECIES: general stress protein [Bacillaceae]NAZ09130.1 general stress protein [Agaribacter marinus]MBR7796421.1 general stress protein [Virgibacillus salarius]MCC2252056.1 general stress protein [Virgibacillus sp. AGTR]MDY7046450.1 general stress protein [Virgibacillus sp. M23]QRZ16770.1 general stress protein [Virgibacillus sp. AGTR]